MQEALKYYVLVVSDGQCLDVVASSVQELDVKLTIFELSLDQSVCGGIIVSDKLLSGPHGLARDGDFCSFPGWQIMKCKEGYVFAVEQAV